ncbi:hypothetical protein GJ496_009675 [Pomphorhynchus laevis]|nr:hypothetical protein GJ496_009675 [Pomphorhynchus laevis]
MLSEIEILDAPPRRRFIRICRVYKEYHNEFTSPTSKVILENQAEAVCLRPTFNIVCREFKRYDIICCLKAVTNIAFDDVHDIDTKARALDDFKYAYKSTTSDAIIELTNGIDHLVLKNQTLGLIDVSDADSLRMKIRQEPGKLYMLPKFTNLIDFAKFGETGELVTEIYRKPSAIRIHMHSNSDHPFMKTNILADEASHIFKLCNSLVSR